MSIAETDATSANLRPGDDLLEIYRRTGAADDFERVVTRYAALVYGECRRVTRDAHDAEDAAQLAFLALAIELRSGGTINRPAGWLQRVAKRHALKIVRSRGRRKRREDAARRDEMLLPDPPLLDPAARDATAGLIRDAIDALPEKHRLPLVLHYFGGMTLEAIARELGLTRTAVGTRLHRARKQLGDRLAERGLVFDAGELSAIVSLLVPAAVIATLHRGAHAATSTAVMAASPATFATSLGHMLVVAGNVSGARPIAAATAVLLCVATSSGLAWVGPSNVAEKLHLKPTQLRQLLNRLFDIKPSFSIGDALRTVAMEDDSDRDSSLGLTTNVGAASPLLEDWSPAPAGRYDVLTQAPTPQPLASPTAVTIPHPSLAQPVVESPPAVATRTPSADPLTQQRPPVQRATPGTSTEKAWATAALNSARGASTSPREDATPDVDGSHTDDVAIGTPDHPALAVGSSDRLGFGSLTVDGSSRGGGGGAGGGGSVMQRAGRVTADNLVIGNRGNGRYDLIDGRIDARRLTVAARAGSYGMLNLAGGELHLADPRGSFVIGDHGDGRLLMGSGTTPGRITGNGGPIVIRAHDEADGSIEGWGSVDSKGPLVNNGKVTADGHGKGRSLDLSGVSDVTNTIDNKPNESNGWYAVNGGKLVLPRITITPGNGTYTWGESVNDTTLDLVNSLRFTTRGQAAATTLQVTLQSTDDPQGFRVALPNHVSLVSLWSFDASNFNPASLAFQVRYDRNALGGLSVSEHDTYLIAYQAGGWQPAANLSLDTSDHIVTGTFGGGVQYLAVGYNSNLIQLSTDSGRRLGLRSDAAQFIAVPPTVSPEPATIGVILSAATLLTRRRRKV